MTRMRVILSSPILAAVLLLGAAHRPVVAPSSISVLGHPYHVYFVSQGEVKEGRQLEFGALGDTFTRERLILVQRDLNHDLTRHILFHEVGHACYFEHLQAGSLPIKLNGDAYATEEEAVESTANEMWQVIRDNPAFVRWLEK